VEPLQVGVDDFVDITTSAQAGRSADINRFDHMVVVACLGDPVTVAT
jgi:hypothetical protein